MGKGAAETKNCVKDEPRLFTHYAVGVMRKKMSKPLDLANAPSNFDTRKANISLSAFLFVIGGSVIISPTLFLLIPCR